MPIRVSCPCGHALSVPDSYAGKSGKCPKCAQIIRIPAAEAAPNSPKTQPVTPSQKVAKAKPAPAKRAPSPSGGALDQLFADAGLGKKTGPVCPGCQAPIKQGSVICVACGFNLQAGQLIQGHKLAEAADQGPFEHKALNEADRFLKKESEDDQALKFVGWPWWVYLAFVIGIGMLITFGVIVREGSMRDENGVLIQAPAETLAGKIQRLPLTGALLVISLAISWMVMFMASLATQFLAFKEKVLCGLLSFFIPGYLYYYAVSRRKKMWKTSFILLSWTLAAVVLLVLTVVYFTNSTAQLEDGSASS